VVSSRGGRVDSSCVRLTSTPHRLGGSAMGPVMAVAVGIGAAILFSREDEERRTEIREEQVSTAGTDVRATIEHYHLTRVPG
jgi:hypothetical protein